MDLHDRLRDPREIKRAFRRGANFAPRWMRQYIRRDILAYRKNLQFLEIERTNEIARPYIIRNLYLRVSSYVQPACHT